MTKQEKTNVLHYLSSMNVIDNLYNKGLINDNDYEKAEQFLKQKYCINDVSLYRSNRLINIDFRVIYMNEKKEVEDAKNNKNKRITKIG